MPIKLIVPCVGRKGCMFFRSPESLLGALEAPCTFQNLMMAIEISKVWKHWAACPFRIRRSAEENGESFHISICSLATRPPYSMDAVSKGTGYSKTRVAQIEYTAFRKLRRVLGKSTLENEVLEKAP